MIDTVVKLTQLPFQTILQPEPVITANTTVHHPVEAWHSMMQQDTATSRSLLFEILCLPLSSLTSACALEEFGTQVVSPEHKL